MKVIILSIGFILFTNSSFASIDLEFICQGPLNENGQRVLIMTPPKEDNIEEFDMYEALIDRDMKAVGNEWTYKFESIKQTESSVFVEGKATNFVATGGGSLTFDLDMNLSSKVGKFTKVTSVWNSEAGEYKKSTEFHQLECFY